MCSKSASERFDFKRFSGFSQRSITDPHFDLPSNYNPISACNERNDAWWPYGAEERAGVKWCLQGGAESRVSWCVMDAVRLDGKENPIMYSSIQLWRERERERVWIRDKWGTRQFGGKHHAFAFPWRCLSCLSFPKSPTVLSSSAFYFFLFTLALFCFSLAESQVFGDSHREINFAWPLCLWKGT